MTEGAFLVLGVGNPDRGDDAVGRMVARSLRTRVESDVRVVEQDGEVTALLAALQTAPRVWLIDAARSGAPPGTIHRIDCSAANPALPRGTVSSHGFGVAEAIALARALGVLPAQCIVYAVEAEAFVSGAALSPPVANAADRLAARIAEEIRADATRPPPASRHRPHPAPATDRR
jgi:hydrogenase maturation protease